MFAPFESYIAINSFIVICTVISVSAIDKTFYGEVGGILNSTRKWSLPLLSIFLGAMFYYLFAKMEGTPITKEHVVFYGMNVGAFATVFYKIVKEAIIKKVSSYVDK